MDILRALGSTRNAFAGQYFTRLGLLAVSALAETPSCCGIPT
ncbi:hypothetical protein [Actinomyces qiguomingii]